MQPGWLAYAVSGTTGSYSVSQTADAGSPFVVAAAPPEIEQTFIPNLKIGDTFWSKFSGISVSDFDTDTGLTLTITSGLLDLAMSQATFDALTNGVDVGNSKTGYNLTSSEHRVSADGLYVVEGDDTNGWEAYAVSGTSGSYSISGTADAGLPGANFRLVDRSDPSNEVITAKANGFTITGSADDINAGLGQLEINLLVDNESLLTFSLLTEPIRQ